MKKRLFALLAVALIGVASAAGTSGTASGSGNQTDGRAYMWSG